MRCPQCQTDSSGEFCPNCGTRIAVQILPPPPSPIAIQKPASPPVIVVTAAPRREPRLRSSGWFTRSFGATAGVLTAFLLFTAAICGGGILWLRESVQSAGAAAAAQDAALTAGVKPLALESLRK